MHHKFSWQQMGKPFYGLIFVACLIRLCFLLLIPFDDRHHNFGITGFNDEMSHIHYVEYLIQFHKLPIDIHNSQEPDAFEVNEFEYYQSPLYYLWAMPFAMLGEKLSPQQPFYFMRLASLICGVLTVALAFFIGCHFRRSIGWVCAWILALFPAHIYYTSIVTNDSLMWLIGASLLWWILKSTSLEKPSNMSNSIGMACILAAGLWCKSSMLTLLPLVFVKPILAFLQQKKLNHFWKPIAAVCIALVLSAPIYLRNLQLYGDLLALESGTGPGGKYLFAFTLHNFYEFISYTISTFWFPLNLTYSYQNIFLKGAMICATILFCATIIWGGVKIFQSKTFFSLAELNSSAFADYAVVWSSLLLCLVGYVQYNGIFRQSDARLFFHALVALFVIFSLALAEIFPAQFKRLDNV